MNTLLKITIGLILLYILIAVTSCSPQRRLNRLVKNHPELMVKDTINIIDTTIRPGSKLESLFDFTGDTVYIRDSVFTIKYFYDTQTHKHYIAGETKADTIIKNIPVYMDKIVVKEPELSFWTKYKDLLPYLLILVIFGIIWKGRK